VEAVVLGRGTGRPGQALELSERLPAGRAFTVWSLEEGRLRSWCRRPDFDASSRSDAHFVVEPRPEDSASGAPLARVRFGDGERGRALPEAARAWAAYGATRGPAGAVFASAFVGLADVAGNRARLTDFDSVAARLAAVENPLPSTGGSSGETIDDAARRALESVERTERAVTLADYERLAGATPGVRLARAEARAERHPALPCYPAPGVVTVLVLPYLPASRPAPSRGLLAAVASFLNRRRVLGTRVEVAGPSYVEVRVRARVKALPGASGEALARRLRAALDSFLHPLTGGPEGSGWSFGRAVYISEVYQVLDETEGADHVLALELIGPDGRVRCDNLCLPPDGLPDAGAHEIAVEGGGDPC
jgi:predicted phage baseplate assembly protein